MKQKGFTLFEVALSCVLLTLLLVGVFSFFSTTYINYLQLEEKSRVQDEARIVENFIKEEIESAKKVTLIDEDGHIISIQSAPSTWKKNEIAEVKLSAIKLDDGARSIVVNDPKTLMYKTTGPSGNVLTDLLKDGSIYVSKDKNSDVVTIKLYLEKERSYRANHPVTVHSFTTYIKVSLKYKYDL